MKKKIVKGVGIFIFVLAVIVLVCNIYTWIFSGNQNIKLNTAKQAYANSDLYVSII